MPVNKKPTKVFSDVELSAMRERGSELRAEAKAKKNRAAGEQMVLAAFAKMPEPDRRLAKRIHAIITTSAPTLWCKTWYGMPAYTKDDKVICFLKVASKYKSRYAEFGFLDSAKLDDGVMWPVVFAIKVLTSTDEAKIAALVKKAVS